MASPAVEANARAGGGSLGPARARLTFEERDGLRREIDRCVRARQSEPSTRRPRRTDSAPERLLEAFRELGAATRKEAAALARVKPATAGWALRVLLNEGRLRPVGSRRSAATGRGQTIYEPGW